ncbi:MAG: thermonuclease family protein [Dehalococcoidia bacterium]|nr:thermonuclease family protein [Dehalococcoidia bacterium]
MIPRLHSLSFLAACILLLSACDSDLPGSSTATPSSPSPSPATTVMASPSFPPGLTPATVIRVVDGDTIVVSIEGREQKLRYTGVNTPETVDPRRPVECFGKEASARNHELVEGRTVGLEKDVSEADDFGRLLRYVWLPGPASEQAKMVNAQLVAEGYAQAATYPPDVKYAELFGQLQGEARAAGRGLWGPACAPTPTPSPAAGACPIKGNISADGERIYHLPGGAFYDQTQIDEAAGERWFCTEVEAVAAGWRRSSR